MREAIMDLFSIYYSALFVQHLYIGSDQVNSIEKVVLLNHVIESISLII